MMDVLSKFIGALSNHFLDNLSKKNIPVDKSKILWVLTVPAIWSEASKRFMREAAEMVRTVPAVRLPIQYKQLSRYSI